MLSRQDGGWLNFKVKPYIPSPLRCYHCQMFGHLIQKCRKKMNEEPALCCNCGKEAHGPCNEPPSCINCGENHPASSKSCMKFILEKEVQTVKVIEKISFKDARKKVLELQIRPGITFSPVIKKSQSSVQVPATHAMQQQPSAAVTKPNQDETTPHGEEHVDDKPKAGCSLNNENSTSLQQPKPQVLKPRTAEIPKRIQLTSSNGTRANSDHRKRERTSGKRKDKSENESNKLSAQKSIVIQSNIPRLKRVKDNN
ncbi:cell growth-regulating nucleolar protein-like [Macrobrachium nipponense]|uniref:cell growth-regulating nucleolar protein-like n=1 Tax=Macrobrachium nipponense TaxID=159736 RepID=UPI0030C88DDF